MNKSKLKVIIIVLAVTAICMIPCCREEIIKGHDTYFHMARIDAICKAIKTGQGLNPCIYQTYLSGYGYAVGLFYPAVFLVPFAILKAVTGISIMLTMKILIAVILLATCFTSYLAGKNISGKSNIGIAVMILYTMGQYHLMNLYKRADIGEAIAMIFVPLVIWGGYELCERKYKKGILCIAFIGLILSHTISAVICFLFLIFWVIIRIKRVFNKKSILGILSEAVICLLITAFYWIPVLEQFSNDDFYVFTNGWTHLEDNFLTFKSLMTGITVAFPEYIILISLICLNFKLKIYDKKAIKFSIISFLLLIIQTRIIPWGLLDKTILKCIQFPWRFNMLGEFAVAMAISCQIDCIISDERLNIRLKSALKKMSVYALLILIGCYNLFISCFFIDKYVIYTDYDFENFGDIGGAEWLPNAITIKSITNSKFEVDSEYSGLVNLGNDYISGTYNHEGSYVFTLDSVYAGHAEVPKIYYKGYTAEAVLTGGETVALSVCESEQGLVCFEIPKGTVSVKVWYNGTIMQEAGKGISVITIFFVILIAIYYKAKRKYVAHKHI